MEDMKTSIGKVLWSDLSVADAPRVAEFYKAVTGWEPSPHESSPTDFNMMLPGTQTPAAGICTAQGVNADIPPQWMIYVPVKDLQASIAACQKLGGQVVCKLAFEGCVIRDPAGACMVIMQA